ncbi:MULTISPECIES: Fur family transcriptional regulator [Anaerococcus]|uniref:Fur family transcriptional regulator n=1 Tax=Anaerococcus TaxID=165779 RepID=UPI00242F5C55|nr:MULTISPECIES: Fur family transcriptional regulator [Anaerococcus]MDD7765925.1 Fur family transcriptional regulator [Anaerococcus vaginalis]MDY6128238.1 Fur family transcriptional regulator [Anaerococcus sp.]
MKAEDLLKRNKIRVTEKRKIILEKIIENDDPISAEEILEKLKEENINMDLSTIYRNLNTLEEINLLLKNTNTDGISYFQLNSNNHKHFIRCISCNKKFIIENCPIHEIEEEIEKDTGFVIKGHSFEFTGICPQCQKKLNK